MQQLVRKICHEKTRFNTTIAIMQARRQQLPQQLQGLWSDIPAWTATLLFMFQPVAQSVSRHSDSRHAIISHTTLSLMQAL